MKDGRKKVIIAGAGFAGLFAAKSLFGKNVDVTIIDRNNYHTFNPLLYQVGAAELEAAEVVYPVRSVLRKRKNINFLMANITGISSAKNTVRTDWGDVEYDYMIYAIGSKPNYFGIKGAEENTLTLGSLDDAMKLRNRILCCFEKAARCSNIEEIKSYLTFVIIGGGPTGVEFAGAFAELVKGPLKKDFPGLDLSLVKIILLDGAKKLLGVYNDKTGIYTKARLEKMGVTIMLNSPVERINRGEVIVPGGVRIKAETILWSAGVSAKTIPWDIKFSDRRDGRAAVKKTLQHADVANIFICGDMAFFEQDGKPVPMMAPAATSMGVFAAKNILALINGREPGQYRFKDRGSMVTIGRNSAVAKMGSFEVHGFVAWVSWLFIHIMYLIGFRNKIFVIINWFLDYIFFERSGRMIIPSCGDDGTVKGGKGQSIRK